MVWQSDKWQEARERLLLSECVQCGSTKKLSLVHLWKPPRYLQIKISIENQLIDTLVKEGKLKPFDPSLCGSDTERNACPDCESVNLRARKTKKPKYRCGRCGTDFEEPLQIMVRDDYIFQQAYRSWKKKQLIEFQEKIEQQVKEAQHHYAKRYESGDGTTTYCGKCTFLWTQKGMKLCSVCKDQYHKRRYEQCFSCHQKDDNNSKVICEKCGEVEIYPQPGDLQICDTCYEKMWDSLTR